MAAMRIQLGRSGRNGRISGARAQLVCDRSPRTPVVWRSQGGLPAALVGPEIRLLGKNKRVADLDAEITNRLPVSYDRVGLTCAQIAGSLVESGGERPLW